MRSRLWKVLSTALIVAGCSGVSHPRVTIRPKISAPMSRFGSSSEGAKRAVEVRWSSSEERAADVNLWNETRWYDYWADVDRWEAYWTWVNAQRIPYDLATWTRVHHCEEGDEWYANGGNPADPGHQTFQGGLGMSTVAWRMAVTAAHARGVTLPGSALAASPDQQMQGAQAFLDAYGWGWACR